MELTIKTQKEIEGLESKINILVEREKRLRKDACASNVSHDIWKALSKEANRISNQSYKLEGKIGEIKNVGISTKEKTQLVKELSSFHTLKYDRSLGARDIEKVGNSKTFGKFIKVNYIHWTSFMGNVRGCSSMANKTDINAIDIINEEEYNKLLKQNGTSTTSFCGSTQTTEMNNVQK